jgi:hypothetical protein
VPYAPPISFFSILPLAQHWLGKKYRSFSFSLCNFLHSPVASSLLGPNTLSSVYSIAIHLRVSGLPLAPHQEVTMYVCDNWHVLYVLSRIRRTTNTICRIYKLLPPDDGLQANPKHIEV